MPLRDPEILRRLDEIKIRGRGSGMELIEQGSAKNRVSHGFIERLGKPNLYSPLRNGPLSFLAARTRGPRLANRAPLERSTKCASLRPPGERRTTARRK
jgi:hypothetical protein